MTRRLVMVGLAIIAVGILMGVVAERTAGVSCGSPWFPSTSAAERKDRIDDMADRMLGFNPDRSDSTVSACDDALGNRGIAASLIVGLGVAVLIGVMFLGAVRERREGTGRSA